MPRPRFRSCSLLRVSLLLAACTNTDAGTDAGRAEGDGVRVLEASRSSTTVDGGRAVDAGGDAAASNIAAVPDAMTVDPEAAACAALGAQWIAGCVDNAVGWKGVAITGVVAEVARVKGSDWSCSGIAYVNARLGDRAWRFRVDDGMQSLWVGVFLPWRSPLVDVGDTVTVTFAEEQAIDGPSRGDLTVLDADGLPIIWIGQGPLQPPEPIQVADGPTECVAEGDCGPLSKRSFVVTAAGMKADVGYGHRTDVGDYVALHGGNDWTGGGGGCIGGGGLRRLAVVRGSSDGLDALDRGPCGSAACGAGEYCALPAAAKCDRSDSDAQCLTVPDSCATDCPGVCGCDGRFYCNACRAERAGVDVTESDTDCMMAGCDLEGGNTSAIGPDACYTQWSCFGMLYEIDCTLEGDVAHCTCRMDGNDVDLVKRARTPNCESDEAAAACGFPSLSHDAP